MNRLDLTLRSTIHIQYANALAFDFSFFGSFFFTAVERKDTYRPLFSLRSKVFCMISIRGDKPPIPPKTQTMKYVKGGRRALCEGSQSQAQASPLVLLRNLIPFIQCKAFSGFVIFSFMELCAIVWALAVY